MELRESDAVLKWSGPGRAILILDASESAAPQQEAIIALTQAVLSTLPAGMDCALYFLGNPAPYPPSNLAGRAGRWFQENRGRASLVTPVWEALPLAEPAKIVIIGAGPIFDLEDWQGTPLAQRLLLVNMGESLQGKHPLAEEVVAPTASDLGRRLYDPVVRVEISGPGFMPTWWDNAAYRLEMTAGEARLVAEGAGDTSLTMHYLCTAAGEAQAVVTRAGGEQAVVPLEPAGAPTPPEGTRSDLRPEEVTILHQVIQGRPFTCLRCGRQHAWDTTRCLEGTCILGEIVYPSLQAQQALGWIVFRLHGEAASFETHPCSVLRLGAAEVAVREVQRTVRYRYDPGKETWRAEGRMVPYYPIGEDAYALLL